MTKTEQAKSDLSYVRAVVERAEEATSPPSIYLLWAILSLIGFTLYDFRPLAANFYWAVAGPIGGIASFVLGWRWGRRAGQGSLRLARYHALHWGGMMAAIFLAVPLHLSGKIDGEALVRVILLLLALGWFTAGIYLVPTYLGNGLLMAAGYVALFFVDQYVWTSMGVLFALTLVIAAVRGGRSAAVLE